MATQKKVTNSGTYVLSDSVDRQITDELEYNPIRKENLRFWMNNVRAIQTTLDLLNVKIKNVLESR